MKNLLATIPSIGDLLPIVGDKYPDLPENFPETAAVGALPELTAEGAAAEFIKLVLEWSMAITLVAIIVAAIYFIISRGKEEDISKAKDIMFYLVIGMAIMSASYALVSGIAQFEFFETISTQPSASE
jgi:hypothetical protein